MKRSYLLLSFVCALLSSCDHYDDRMTFVNNSQNKICIDYSTDSILKIPSTNKVEYYLSEKINPCERKSYVLPGSTSEWPRLVKSSKNRKLYFFVFRYEDLQKKNWDSMRNKNQYLQRIEYSLDELEKNNWVVTIN